MPFVPKSWLNSPSTSTPISAAALQDMETRLSDYMDDRVDPVESTATVVKEAPLNLKDERFGGVGDGVANETAALAAARAISAPYGREILLPGGVWDFPTGIPVLGSREVLRGLGKGEVSDSQGITTITSAHNGTVVEVADNAIGWGIRDLAITGDRTKASQDLLLLGQTAQGDVTRVTAQKAGRDCIVCEATLNANFEGVYTHSAKRYGLKTSGQANALKFTKCLFRVCDQYGIYIGGGTGIDLDCCTIESNSQDGSTAYGGMLIDPNDADASAFVSVHMTACHFENNDGIGAGVPIKVLTGTRRCAVSEIGNTYSESNALVLNYGAFRSIAVFTNIGPHATIASGVLSSWIAPYNSAGANFSVTDNSAKTIILGGDAIGGVAGVKFGDAITLTRNSGSGVLTVNQKFAIVQGLGVGNSAAASEVIGKAVTKKIQVFDENGNSIGYVPVYSSIT